MLPSSLPLSRGRLMEYPITHCSERGMFEFEVVCQCVCVCEYVCVCTPSRQDIGADIWEINTSISLCLTLYIERECDPPLPVREENKGNEEEKRNDRER